MTYTVEIAGRIFDGTETAGQNIWLADGLTGWFDGANSRAKFDDIPGQHGGFQPATIQVSARHFEFNGAIIAESDSAADAIGRAWLASLSVKNGFDVKVTDATGTLTARCWVDGKPVAKRLASGAFSFSLPLVAPDPIRYGESTTTVVSGAHTVIGGIQYGLTYGVDYGSIPNDSLSGLVTMFNAGTADSYPWFRVAGPVATGFTITSDAFTIRFTRGLVGGEVVTFGPAYGGRAVMQDGSDVSSFLTAAQWAPVPAGGSRGYLFTPISTASNGSFFEANMRDGWW